VVDHLVGSRCRTRASGCLTGIALRVNQAWYRPWRVSVATRPSAPRERVAGSHDGEVNQRGQQSWRLPLEHVRTNDRQVSQRPVVLVLGCVTWVIRHERTIRSYRRTGVEHPADPQKTAAAFEVVVGESPTEFSSDETGRPREALAGSARKQLLLVSRNPNPPDGHRRPLEGQNASPHSQRGCVICGNRILRRRWSRPARIQELDEARRVVARARPQDPPTQPSPAQPDKAPTVATTSSNHLPPLAPFPLNLLSCRGANFIDGSREYCHLHRLQVAV